MEFGLIGYPLKHSFSKEIHNYISDYKYDIHEIDENNLDVFMNNKNFHGINVTIPYKKKVIPYLDYIDSDAKNINAVNTIINIDEKLYGYNTDILGVLDTFSYFKIDFDKKVVLILGTGATSNTVYYASKKANAKKIYKAYRNNSKIKGDILYSELNNIKDEINIIINTTSNGMYPHFDDSVLLDLKKFINLEAVIDVVYNPLRTKLLIEAEKLNIKSVFGLYMLVSQAYFASKLFTNPLKNTNSDIYLLYKNSQNRELESIYKKCIKNKQNIVLIGMPTCGKSTIGKMLSEKFNYEFIDTDSLIENKINSKIVDFINSFGEEKFREIETEVIKEISSKNHHIISTGGGAVLRDDNVYHLKSNGKLFFINRSLKNLLPSSDRPLTNNIEALRNKYFERLPIYKSSCDIEINGDLSFDDKIKTIMSYIL